MVDIKKLARVIRNEKAEIFAALRSNGQILCSEFTKTPKI